ncbi:hypothetical protein AK812_SmicGene37351 [Symbiodinium microadriaticum]|uniref:Uncharacterized protein n=1 Tax=Symbiodinium microadriaticum TaxID=2951 RepID=A0A1Q9CGG9_SYMMI|nr:hypothetical protein AK812_SmicGene37351 [Symbiodinium microadriaticum]
MGKVGDPVGQHFLSKVQLKNTSVPGQFRYSYWMASGVFDSASCYDLQTDCVQATDSELYQLEAFNVEEAKLCNRYAYRCCDLHGMGGCDLELTPWTKREPSVQGRIEALAKHVLSCKVAALYSMKDPYKIRKRKSPLPLSYANFEGFYFPTSRVEGRLLYHMDHAFDRQAAAAVRNFSFDPHHGHWCLFLATWLISSAEDLFEVTAMGPMKSKQEPGAPMKELKIVKFKLPPRMTQRKLEKLELEDEAMNHFQPSRELAGYDLNMVERKLGYKWEIQKVRLEELNLMENFMRTTVSSTDFDVSRLLKFDELQSFASPMRQRKREDKKSEKSKSKMDNMMKKDEGKAKKKDKWEANDVYEGVDQDIETADQEKGETWAKASGNANSFLSHPEVQVASPQGRDEEAEEGGGEGFPVRNSDRFDWVEERPDPQLFGTVPEAMEKCAERQEIRAQKLAEQEVKHEVKQNYLDLTTTGLLALPKDHEGLPGGATHRFLQWTGVVEGLNARIVEFLSETTSFGFSQHKPPTNCGWAALKPLAMDRERLQLSGCVKTFCDMHCIEDAVLKGNSAILKSLKTQAQRIDFYNGLAWYTTELFDKLKETQDQSSQNFLEQERVLKAYFEQMADMETGYANQVNTQIDQLGVDINSRFKNNVDHLNVLQKHLKTVNDNIISLANWLGNQPMFATDDDHTFTPPHSVLLLGFCTQNGRQGADPSRIVDTKGISVQKPPHVEAQENFGAAQMALADLLAQIHQAYSDLTLRVDSASDEEQIVPLLSGLQAAWSLLRFGVDAAVNASRGVVQALRQATTGLRALPKQGVEALVVAGISSSLSQFGMSPSFAGVNQDSQQDRRYDYQKLMTSIHRDVSEYIQKAKVHVNAHKGTLLQLLSANATQLGFQHPLAKSQRVEASFIWRLVAEMQRTEEDHVLSLLRTWKTLAENLDSLANLLVEGELLHSELSLGDETSSHRSAVLDDSATEGLLAAAGDTGSLDLAAYLSLIEESLARSLSSNLLPFMKQSLQDMLSERLSQAFDLSQFLADMCCTQELWVFGSFDVPETELTLVQTAWSRATKTAHGLLAQNSSMLPFRLLRLAVERAEEAMATNLFMAPDICTSGMQLWNMTSGYQSTAINAAFSSLLQQLNMRMS